MNNVTEYEYAIVDEEHITIADIQNEARNVWQELHTSDSAIAKMAMDQGIDVSQLPEIMEDALEIRPSAQGIDPSTIAIIVAIVNSPAVARVSSDIWTYVILPHIRDKFGDHSIEKRNKEQE